MIVRQFKVSDAPAASKIIKKCLIEINAQFYPTEVIAKMEKMYTPDRIIEIARDRLFLVAEEFDEQIIGTATISNNFFGSVFVHPDYQGRGVGGKLMQTLEKLAKSLGRTEVILHASINAVEFYEKQGYTKIRQVEDNKFGNSFEMQKNLQ